MQNRGPALGLLGLAGFILFVAAPATWATVQFPDAGALIVEIPGQSLAPLISAVASVLLGALAAILLLKGWGRVLVAGIAGTACAGLLIQIGSQVAGNWTSKAFVSSVALAHSGVTIDASAVSVPTVSWSAWPTVTFVTAAAAFAVCVLIALFSRQWPIAVRRYERTVTDDSPAGTWDAMTKGADPTAQSGDNESAGRG